MVKFSKNLESISLWELTRRASMEEESNKEELFDRSYFYLSMVILRMKF
jgi:hypothetical protein